MKRSYAGGL